MRDAASDVCSIAHERAATKQTARQAAAHPGFDDMAPAAALLALRICTSYSTRLAPCIRGHLVRNAAHEGSCISLLSLELWIERVAQPVAHEIESEHSDENRKTRESHDPRRSLYELQRIGEHRAPLGRGR